MLKLLPAIFAVVLAFTNQSQSQTFYYDQIQQRDSSHQWNDPLYIGNQKATLTDTTIELTVKSKYELSIISKTLLPGNGAIYLCRDSKQHEVTVMVMPDNKLIVYDDADRFLIDMDQPMVRLRSRGLADSD